MLQGLYNGLSGLKTAQLTLDVTSDNIANADTEGYNKRVFSSDSNPSIIRNYNTLGTGVTDQPIVRSHDEMVFSKLKLSLSQLSSDKVIKNGLSDLNEAFTKEVEAENSLSSLQDDFFYTLELISQDPENENLHTEFKSKLQSFFDRKDKLDTDLNNNIDVIDIRIENARKESSLKLKEFDELSKSIAEYESANSSNIKNRYLNDLRDKRDLVEEKLSSLGSFRVQKTKDGSGTYNISDDSNLIYSRDFNETSGEINGLNQLRDSLVTLKDSFSENFDSFSSNLNNSYKSVDINSDLFENGKVTNDSLNFSSSSNEVNNNIALDMLNFRTDDSGFKDLVSSLENKYKSSNTQHMYSESLFKTYEDNMNSISKVNIDEEMTNLIKYQRAYEANAVVIRTMDEILKTTINLKT